MAKKVGRTTKTETVSARLAPRMKHLLDIVGRSQRRSMAAVIEVAIEGLASGKDLEIANSTWSTNEDERLINLYLQAPHLCSFDEEVDAIRLLAGGEG